MTPRKTPPYRERMAALPGLPLTNLELQILRMVAEGQSDAEVGARLYVTADTVKGRMNRIRVKLGARNRAHTVHRAWQEGYLKPSPGGDDQ